MARKMKVVVQRNVATNLSRQAALTAVTYAGLQGENEVSKILSVPPQRTGRVYKHGTVRHKASADGESPAPHTGELRQSVKSVVNEASKTAEAIVGTPLKRAKALELGTEKIRPRPFLSRLAEPRRVQRMLKAARAGVRAYIKSVGG
jgi:hypothetical protein